MPEATFTEQLLDLVFPVSCLSCGSHGRPLCGRCLAELARHSNAREGNQRWRRQTDRTPASSDIRAIGDYGGLLKEMVLRLKSSQRPLAVPLSRLMLAAAGNEPAYLAPEQVFCVPSEKAKVKQRGYNPAELLAMLIARHLGRPLELSLLKTRHTLDQDGLSGKERWANVADAFMVAPDSRVRGKVLLVDDVLTTGATADSCARVLVEAGADRVNVLVAARAIFNRK